MEEKETENQIIEIVLKWGGIRKEKVHLDVQINHELGIQGDDAIDLFLECSEKFNIDTTSFMFDDYFESEGFSIFEFFFPKKRKPYTVKDLIEAAISKKMINP